MKLESLRESCCYTSVKSQHSESRYLDCLLKREKLPKEVERASTQPANAFPARINAPLLGHGILRESKQLLHSLDGMVPEGALCALMGPSGSGKSTLLDLLTGRKNYGSCEGTLLYKNTSVADQQVRRRSSETPYLDTTGVVSTPPINCSLERGNACRGRIPCSARCLRVIPIGKEFRVLHQLELRRIVRHACGEK